ncbi:unnamed protein product [Linum tenue]|uniref:Protein kinase domain-containing protein n=1 Tax=Linum tenue TaxID=586396 RepID=A0AAV0JPL5_9ROSI|nr:unnamed protein product [Linum tenue]
MCNSRKSTEIRHSSRTTKPSSSFSSSSSFPNPSYYNSATHSSNSRSNFDASKSSSSSKASLASLRDSLPENATIYDVSEISRATHNFLLKPFSSSSTSTSWRCTIRGRDAVLFQRKLRRAIELPELQQRLLTICRSHYSSLVKLLGATISGRYIYLVYDYVPGSSLANCLRNPQNPSFTVLSTWLSRMQIATDVAHGLDYVHHCSGLNFVHNHVKSSSILVTETTLNAKICHFGTAELCGEIDHSDLESKPKSSSKSSGTRRSKIEGTRGYMAPAMICYRSPEYQNSKKVSRKTDVWSYGGLLLELLTGRVSTYSAEKNGGGGGGGGGRVDLWNWVYRAVREEWTCEVLDAEIGVQRNGVPGMLKLLQLAMRCCEKSPEKRPEMAEVLKEVEGIKAVGESEDEEDLSMEQSLEDESISTTTTSANGG